jgi:hypothetical protein
MFAAISVLQIPSAIKRGGMNGSNFALHGQIRALLSRCHLRRGEWIGTGTAISWA